MNEKAYQAKARVMKALSSPARLMILDQLKQGERCLCELQPLFKQDKSTLSRHVRELCEVGILAERRDGVRVYLSLATPCILNIFDCVMGVIQSEAKRTSSLVSRGAAA
ncbi:MAG TPA: metalloregulator ArsR/SmtB family transcription factor [Kiritimatiellia bacterium]|nr:metalloregulator ArsR/SmtB family transcription factor [Kiritimatiellia bacterium]HMO98535.1 metalloregulator ArsR/SmtB family transcription factor [Kiritimatiellia bacterium]HMP96979.1 metalloregulator ArsR/SmtB family transcription factor [Kiritimatiellia bacterium]